MRLCVVLSFLCLLAALTACAPTPNAPRRRGLVNAAAMMRGEINKTMAYLDAPSIFPDTSCPPTQPAELAGARHRNLTAGHLSCFRDLLHNVTAALSAAMSGRLRRVVQLASDVEEAWRGAGAPDPDPAAASNRTCSPPAFEQNMDRYIYVRCLLELLHGMLSGATFPSDSADDLTD